MSSPVSPVERLTSCLLAEVVTRADQMKRDRLQPLRVLYVIRTVLSSPQLSNITATQQACAKLVVYAFALATACSATPLPEAEQEALLSTIASAAPSTCAELLKFLAALQARSFAATMSGFVRRLDREASSERWAIDHIMQAEPAHRTWDLADVSDQVPPHLHTNMLQMLYLQSLLYQGCWTIDSLPPYNASTTGQKKKYEAVQVSMMRVLKMLATSAKERNTPVQLPTHIFTASQSVDLGHSFLMANKGQSAIVNDTRKVVRICQLCRDVSNRKKEGESHIITNQMLHLTHTTPVFVDGTPTAGERAVGADNIKWPLFCAEKCDNGVLGPKERYFTEHVFSKLYPIASATEYSVAHTIQPTDWQAAYFLLSRMLMVLLVCDVVTWDVGRVCMWMESVAVLRALLLPDRQEGSSASHATFSNKYASRELPAVYEVVLPSEGHMMPQESAASTAFLRASHARQLDYFTMTVILKVGVFVWVMPLSRLTDNTWSAFNKSWGGVNVTQPAVTRSIPTEEARSGALTEHFIGGLRRLAEQVTMSRVQRGPREPTQQNDRKVWNDDTHDVEAMHETVSRPSVGSCLHRLPVGFHVSSAQNSILFPDDFHAPRQSQPLQHPFSSIRAQLIEHKLTKQRAFLLQVALAQSTPLFIVVRITDEGGLLFFTDDTNLSETQRKVRQERQDKASADGVAGQWLLEHARMWIWWLRCTSWNSRRHQKHVEKRSRWRDKERGKRRNRNQSRVSSHAPLSHLLQRCLCEHNNVGDYSCRRFL